MSTAAATRAGQLLRRFELPASATREQLRVAYFEKAKNLHPDIAGKSSEAAFRRIKEEYEEAMRLLREAENSKRSAPRQSATGPSRASKSAEQAYWEAWQATRHRRENWQQSYRPHQQAWHQTANQAGQQQEEQTPAKRIRNVLLVSGSVVGAAILLTNWSGRRKVPPPMPLPAAAFARPASTVASDSEVSEPNDLPVDSIIARTSSQRPERRVSDYYQSRTTKSTVRVRSSDTYESPSAPLKSRQASGGLPQALKPTLTASAIPAEKTGPEGDQPPLTVAAADRSNPPIKV